MSSARIHYDFDPIRIHDRNALPTMPNGTPMNLLDEITLWASVAIILTFLWFISTPLGVIAIILFIVWYITRSREYKAEPEVHTNQLVWEKFVKQSDDNLR